MEQKNRPHSPRGWRVAFAVGCGLLLAGIFLAIFIIGGEHDLWKEDLETRRQNSLECVLSCQKNQREAHDKYLEDSMDCSNEELELPHCQPPPKRNCYKYCGGLALP